MPASPAGVCDVVLWWSRMLFGSRWSLGTAAIATALIMTIGLAVGSLAGNYGGALDDMVVLVIDVLLAFPSLVLALAIAGTLGPRIVNVMIGLVSVWWVGYAPHISLVVIGFNLLGDGIRDVLDPRLSNRR